MAKASRHAYFLLSKFLAKQTWRPVFDAKLMSARKRAAIGNGIFDDVNDDGPAEAKETIAAR